MSNGGHVIRAKHNIVSGLVLDGMSLVITIGEHTNDLMTSSTNVPGLKDLVSKNLTVLFRLLSKFEIIYLLRGQKRRH